MDSFLIFSGQQKRLAQDPMFGGAGLWDAPFRIKAVNGDRYTLSGGSLLGLSKGCILKVLAAGDPNAWLTREAAACVQRLARRSVVPGR